jgi:hypothetical protein
MQQHTREWSAGNSESQIWRVFGRTRSSRVTGGQRRARKGLARRVCSLAPTGIRALGLRAEFALRPSDGAGPAGLEFLALKPPA